MNNYKIKPTNYGRLFMFCFSIMFISRIFAIISDYNILAISYIYIVIAVFIGTYSFKKIILNLKINSSIILSIALLLYILLFCIIFVNPIMKAFTNVILKRQGMFVILTLLTAWIIKEHKLFDEFLLASFFSLSFVLLFQFLTNLSDLKFLNITNIMSSSERTRANFGFGHYNTLGGACLYNIFIGLLIKKRNLLSNTSKVILWFFILLSVLMMLVSASRSSISGLLVYICLCFYLNMQKNNKNFGRIIKVILILMILLITLLNVNISFNNMLNESNRIALFKVALPTFFNSGRELFGLGLASPEAFGMGETPYYTKWLDNGYVYTLVTTGYIGCIIYFSALIAIAIKIFKSFRCEIGTNMICIFIVYLYTALFEATLFMGNVPNYICIILFLVYTNDYFFIGENNDRITKNYFKHF